MALGPARAASARASRKPRFYEHLYVQVLVAILLGGIVGYVWPEAGASLKPLGDVFVKLIKMIIAPVIFLTLSAGIAGMSDLRRLGGLAGKVVVVFLALSTLALVVGLAAGNLLHPGAGLNASLDKADPASVASYVGQAHDLTVIGYLTSIVPDTVLGAFTSGNILQVLFFSILFGVALALTGEPARPVIVVLESANRVFAWVVRIVMYAAPLGAFGAFAFTIGKFGVGSIVNLAALVGVTYGTAITFVIVVGGLLGWANGFSIFALIRYLSDELFLVLGTSSSESALPRLMEKLERAGCAKPVVGVAVPMGYSFNLDGTNIYLTLAALFIAQAYNVHLTLGQQLLLLGVAMISSKGAAGVTGSGFVTLAATLAIVPSVPVAGMTLILGVDRFMSECRALTNFIGTAAATIVVSNWDKALDREKLKAALGGKSSPSFSGAPQARAEDPGDVERAVGSLESAE
jgi:aerobic C4-dicarboxylate transport protein